MKALDTKIRFTFFVIMSIIFAFSINVLFCSKISYEQSIIFRGLKEILKELPDEMVREGFNTLNEKFKHTNELSSIDNLGNDSSQNIFSNNPLTYRNSIFSMDVPRQWDIIENSSNNVVSIISPKDTILEIFFSNKTIDSKQLIRADDIGNIYEGALISNPNVDNITYFKSIDSNLKIGNNLLFTLFYDINNQMEPVKAMFAGSIINNKIFTATFIGNPKSFSELLPDAIQTIQSFKTS